MFKWLHRSSPEASLGKINQQFLGMLDSGRHMFDAAANCVLGGTDPQVVREDLFTTDQQINATEQLIRREIVVHGTVHGPTALPGVLVMMNMVKDAERIGDYCKNIFDLAAKGAVLHDDGEERRRILELKDRISKMMAEARTLVQSQEVEPARRYTWDADQVTDECDAAIDRLLKLEGVNPAATVLLYRYFKRVVAHLSNIVSSIFMPVDKLDFFDEPRATRP